MIEDRLYPMRLQKFLARAGAASRRGAENLMTAGRVKVNGVVVTELGSKVDPERDVVSVDGVVYSIADEAVYVMLNKPAGYLTTMKDPQGRHCVAELVPTKRYPGLFPVGRLDKDTTGILLFTTDGQAAQVMLHPSHHVEKHYVALVEGELKDSELDALRAGITLEDGPCAPAVCKILSEKDRLAKLVQPSGVVGKKPVSVVSIRIHEGRKHQVKRMMAAIGHPVVRLHRQSFGPLELKGVKPGSWRLLTEDECREIQALSMVGGI